MSLVHLVWEPSVNVMNVLMRIMDYRMESVFVSLGFVHTLNLYIYIYWYVCVCIAVHWSNESLMGLVLKGSQILRLISHATSSNFWPL